MRAVELAWCPNCGHLWLARTRRARPTCGVCQRLGYKTGFLARLAEALRPYIIRHPTQGGPDGLPVPCWGAEESELFNTIAGVAEKLPFFAQIHEAWVEGEAGDILRALLVLQGQDNAPTYAMLITAVARWGGPDIMAKLVRWPGP